MNIGSQSSNKKSITTKAKTDKNMLFTNCKKVVSHQDNNKITQVEHRAQKRKAHCKN